MGFGFIVIPPSYHFIVASLSLGMEYLFNRFQCDFFVLFLFLSLFFLFFDDDDFSSVVTLVVL